MRDIEDVHVRRIIEFMNKAIRTPPLEEVLKERHNDFKSFYTQYDERRGKNFRATFDPIIVDWYDTLTVEKSDIMERAGDPSSDKVFKIEKVHG